MDFFFRNDAYEVSCFLADRGKLIYTVIVHTVIDISFCIVTNHSNQWSLVCFLIPFQSAGLERHLDKSDSSKLYILLNSLFGKDNLKGDIMNPVLWIQYKSLELFEWISSENSPCHKFLLFEHSASFLIQSLKQTLSVIEQPPRQSTATTSQSFLHFRFKSGTLNGIIILLVNFNVKRSSKKIWFYSRTFKHSRNVNIIFDWIRNDKSHN